jgi:hypothetical protein
MRVTKQQAGLLDGRTDIRYVLKMANGIGSMEQAGLPVKTLDQSTQELE